MSLLLLFQPQTTFGPKLATFTDSFSNNARNPSKWLQYGAVTTPSQSGGNLNFTTTTATGYGGYTSAVTNYDFTGSSTSIQVVSAGNQALGSLELYPLQVVKTGDSTTVVWWYINSGFIRPYKKVGGTQTALSTFKTYSAATYKYLRIREAAGITYWEYSADAVTWNIEYQEADPFPMTSVSLEIAVGVFSVEASGTVVSFDNFNLAGVTTYVDETMAITPTTGTLVNNNGASAGWNAGGYYQLNNNVNQYADLEYTGALPSLFTSKADMQMSNTAGADACWFYYGFATTPTTEGDAGGYLIERNDIGATFAIRYNGAVLVTANYTRDTAFDTVQIDVSGQAFTITYKGVVILNYTDPTARTLPGTKYGWGARSGGTGNTHNIKNLSLTSTSSAATYSLTATMPATSTMSAALSNSSSLASTMAASASMSAALNNGTTLASTMPGTATLAGAIKNNTSLASSLAASSTMSGVIANVDTLASTMAASSTTSAAIANASSLASTMAASSTLTGNLSAIQSIASTMAATSTTSAAINIAAAPITVNLTVDGDVITTGWNAEAGDFTRLQTDDGDTTRLYTPTAADIRIVSFSNNAGYVGGTINSVTVYAKVRSIDPVSNTLQIGVRIGTTNYWSATMDAGPGQAYGLFSNTWNLNPATGLAWTPTEVDALQGGLQKINGVGMGWTYSFAAVSYVAAVNNNLASTMPGTSNTTAAINNTTALASTMPAGSTTTGALNNNISLSASAAGTSTTSGVIANKVSLASTMASAATMSGAIAVTDILASAMVASANITAAIANASTLTDTMVASSSMSASLITIYSLTSTMAGTSTMSTAITVTEALASTMAGTSTTTATINAVRTLAASSPGTSTTTAAIAVTDVLAASMAATSTMSDAISNSVVLTASMPASANLTAAFGASTLPLASNMPASASMAADVAGFVTYQLNSTMSAAANMSAALANATTLSDTMLGTSNMSAALVMSTLLASTMPASSTMSGVLAPVIKALASTMVASSTMVATIGNTQALTDTMAGSSNMSGAIAVTLPLASTMPGASTMSAALAPVIKPISATMPATSSMTAAQLNATTLAAALNSISTMSAIILVVAAQQPNYGAFVRLTSNIKYIGLTGKPTLAVSLSSQRSKQDSVTLTGKPTLAVSLSSKPVDADPVYL